MPKPRRCWPATGSWSVTASIGVTEIAARLPTCPGPDYVAASEEVMDLLAGLVHKSILVVNNHGDRARYRLLETIRQYGQQRLHDLGQDTALRRAHRDYYQHMAARAAAQWCSRREIAWLSQLRQELPNLRAALDFCLTQPGQAQAGLTIAANLARARCWFFSSTLREGRHWLERACPGSTAGQPAADRCDGTSRMDRSRAG